MGLHVVGRVCWKQIGKLESSKFWNKLRINEIRKFDLKSDSSTVAFEFLQKITGQGGSTVVTP